MPVQVTVLGETPNVAVDAAGEDRGGHDRVAQDPGTEVDDAPTPRGRAVVGVLAGGRQLEVDNLVEQDVVDACCASDGVCNDPALVSSTWSTCLSQSASGSYCSALPASCSNAITIF